MTKENLPENLLRLMRAKNYVPQTLPELALQLRLERKNLPQLKKILAEMLKDGSIAKVKGDRYGASAEHIHDSFASGAGRTAWDQVNGIL